MKLLFSYGLALFINLIAVAAMLPTMVKLCAILNSEYVRTLEFLLLLERELKPSEQLLFPISPENVLKTSSA